MTSGSMPENPVARIRHNLFGLRMPRALEALDAVSVCAFTRFGTECLRDIVDKGRRAGRAPSKAAKSK